MKKLILEENMSSHDSLNFFNPNKDIPAHYENQLTRAFLVVLRISPAAHQVWLSLVAPGRKLYELPRPWSFDTQRHRMLRATPDTAEPIQGISVLQSADVQVVDGPIQITNRGQVLDGIVRYGDELLIVIETKLDGSVATNQARDLNIHGAHVRFDGEVHTVSWRDLLAAWSDLVESEVVVGAERALIIDFLDYVERYFSRLGPYTTLARCKDNAFRIRRRLSSLLNEIAGGIVEHWLELSERSTVDRASMKYDEPSQHISLVLCPADTLAQAKAFYKHLKAASAVPMLPNWKIEPNFHFGYMAKGFVWTTTDVSPEEYIAYWCERIESTGVIPREGWEKFWDELVQRRFAKTEEKAQFDHNFTNTNRKLAIPRPGLACSYSWKLSDAVILDEKDLLVSAVVDQLNVFLLALGEKPIKANKGPGSQS